MNTPEAWIPLKAFEAYENWELRRRAQEAAREDGQSCEREMGPEYFEANILQISAYREFYFVPEYRDLDFFSVDDIEEWWMPEAFRAMTLYEPLIYRTRSRASSTTSQFSSRPSSRMSILSSDASVRPSATPSAPPSSPELLPTKRGMEIIDISSGSSDEGRTTAPPAVPSKRRHKKGRKVKAESESEIEIVGRPRAVACSAKKRKRTKSTPDPDAEGKGSIKVTTQTRMEALKGVKGAQSTWDVPRDKTAYRVNLKGVNVSEGNNGKPRTLDAYIRAKDQDAWGGSTGQPNGDVDVYNLTPTQAPGESIRCRRVDLKCRGVKVCSQFDQSLLKDCIRYERDGHEELATEIWEQVLTQNKTESGSVEAIVVRFYERIQATQCKKPGCNGVPVIKHLKKPDRNGKNLFVGCSNWRSDERWDHLYIMVPPNVHEDALMAAAQGDGKLP